MSRPRVYIRRPAVRFGCGPLGCSIPLLAVVVVLGVFMLIGLIAH